MITLEDDRLVFRFPGVHDDACCMIGFKRTLRIPDDGKNYPLPPGLGRFPLRHLDDHASQLLEGWRRRGGVIAPMHQAEAMWIDFDVGAARPAGAPRYPFAVKIATGKICALTGDSWVERLNTDPQDYVALPEQPWLDGYCVEKGVVRQFVAMPLGDGYTVEEQLTGAARHGGVQIVVYPMKGERYERLKIRYSARFALDSIPRAEPAQMAPAMGLSPGGRMRQKIHEDPYDLGAWDQRRAARCFVTIANSRQWMEITGERPPTTPPTARRYTEAGLPWFERYGGDTEAIAGASKLRPVASVAQLAAAKGREPLPDNETVEPTRVVGLGKAGARRVREFSANHPSAP